MLELEKIKSEILSGKPLEEVLDGIDWREFENFISEIFSKNDYSVKRNFRFKTSRRFEIDLIASRKNLTFCVDCKNWSGGRSKKSGIISAIEKQYLRVQELRKFMRNNFIAKKILTIEERPKVLPLIVTLLQEDVLKENGIFVVPIWKLNSFLLGVENFV